MMGCDISVYCTLQSIMCRSNKCSNPNICSFSNEEYVVSLIVLGDRKSNPQGRLFYLDPNFCTLTSETKLPTGDHYTIHPAAVLQHFDQLTIRIGRRCIIDWQQLNMR